MIETKLISIQVQAILYNNKKENILRTIDSFSKALEISKLYNQHISLTLKYGDASSNPVFSEEEIRDIQKKYTDINFTYNFFGFNSGFGKGQNILSKNWNGDYIFIINPDIICASNLFLEILKPFNSDLKVGISEARQTPIEHPKQYDKMTGEVSWASGVCSLVPTRIFNEIEGFDADTFFLYCEDVDFSWRVRLAGYKIIYQPSAMVFHSKKFSDIGNWYPTDDKKYYFAESTLMMAYKWSNNEKLNKMLDYFSYSKNEFEKKVFETFIKRRAENKLPQPIDTKNEISEFVENNYAKHRFVL